MPSPARRSNVRRGNADDPLAGVVRVTAPDERDVDVIVGRGDWQRAVVGSAELVRLPDDADTTDGGLTGR
jgi:hypothetical protein